MSLGSSSVRRRMVVLVALPMAALLAISATVAVDRLQRANSAGEVVHSMAVVNEVRGVLAQLEKEEVTSVGFLVGVQTANDVEAQAAQVSDQVADLEATLGTGLPDNVRTAVDARGGLAPVRQGVLSRNQTAGQVVDAYSATINSIITSLSLAADADTSTAAGRQVLALDALLRIDAVHAAGAADLLAAVATRDEASVVDYAADQRSAAVLENQLTAYASPAQLDTYGLVRTAYVQRLGDSFVFSFFGSPGAAIANLSSSSLYPQLTSYLQLGGLVEAKIVAAVTDAARDEQRTFQIDAYIVAGAALLTLLLVLLLSWLGIRSVSRSLVGVATAASRAADRSEIELRRVADDHTESVEHSTLDALPVAARTEVGDFARAFVRAQRSAAAIVERQAAARRNLAQMTGTAGRRSAQLVARQANLIDRLERTQSDPQLLSELRRLDHITNRLRRVTASLLTLAIAGEGGRHAADESGYVTPMALADVVQFALAEIDSETRVDVSIPIGTMVVPAIIDDVVLLFAELIANATAFSRRTTRVRVFARPFDSGVSIIDEGLGMSEDQLATINARLAHPERLDHASSGALGLFLVGRLARRHDLRVAFEHTPGGGVTAIVDLGHHVTTMAPAETARATARVAAGASIPRPRDGHVDTMVGAPRGSWEPLLELDSRPFDLETFERASEVLGTGPTWDAFEVGPTRFAELPAGPSQPELPGRAATVGYSGAPVAADGFRAYAAGDYPGPAPDFRDDMPRAGRGFARPDPTAFFGASSNGGHSNGGHSNGDGSNGAGSGGPNARPARPFAGMNRAVNDPLTGPLRRPGAVAPAGPSTPVRSGWPAGSTRADDSNRPGGSGQPDDSPTPFGPGSAGAPVGSGPFDEDGAAFPAGGIARYVPPAEPAEPAGGRSGGGAALADPVSTIDVTSADADEPPLSRRVPGASSPAYSLDLASRFRTLDPDEARRLVEQFEIGVARALGETATDRVDDEGLSR